MINGGVTIENVNDTYIVYISENTIIEDGTVIEDNTIM